ncbi:MAG: hypothetical protein ACOCXT_06960, partial [Candidatus Dojkabacteria bacterium]
GEKRAGGSTFRYTLDSLSNKNLPRLYPAFIKGGEPIILPLSLQDSWKNRVRIFPESNYTTTYNHYDTEVNLSAYKDVSSTIEVTINGRWEVNWKPGDLSVKEKGSGKNVTYQKGSKGELMFNLEEGKSYVVTLK